MTKFNQVETSVLIYSEYDRSVVKIEKGASIDEQGVIRLKGLQPATIGTTTWVELNHATNQWLGKDLCSVINPTGYRSLRLVCELEFERNN